MGKSLVTNDHWEKYADQYGANETVPAAQFISTQNGKFKLGDEVLGKEMCVIVCDVVRENTYYEGRYNANDPSPPRCYAFGRTEDDMIPGMFIERTPDGSKVLTERDLFAEKDPNEEWFEPQAEVCSECPMAEWGSSDTGRGKACQERRRISVIPAGVYVKNKKTKERELELYADPEDIEEVAMAYLKVPITSVKHWAKYVKEITTMRQPPFGVVTRIFLEESAENQFEMHFELIEVVEPELRDAVLERHKEARDTIVQPYRVPDEDSPQSARSLKSKKKGRR